MKTRNARRRQANAYLRYLLALGDDVLVPWSVIAYTYQPHPRSSRRRKLRFSGVVR